MTSTYESKTNNVNSTTESEHPLNPGGAPLLHHSYPISSFLNPGKAEAFICTQLSFLIIFCILFCDEYAFDRCKNIPIKPQTTEDGDVYCMACVEKFDGQTTAAQSVEKMIGNLQVCCLNHGECEWNGKLREWKSHDKNECENRLSVCPFSSKFGCSMNELMPIWQCNEHLQSAKLDHIQLQLNFVLEENLQIKQRMSDLEKEIEELQNESEKYLYFRDTAHGGDDMRGSGSAYDLIEAKQYADTMSNCFGFTFDTWRNNRGNKEGIAWFHSKIIESDLRSKHTGHESGTQCLYVKKSYYNQNFGKK